MAKIRGGDSEERVKLLSEFAWSLITMGPSPDKVLGLFLWDETEEPNVLVFRKKLV